MERFTSTLPARPNQEAPWDSLKRGIIWKAIRRRNLMQRPTSKVFIHHPLSVRKPWRDILNDHNHNQSHPYDQLRTVDNQPQHTQAGLKDDGEQRSDISTRIQQCELERQSSIGARFTHVDIVPENTSCEKNRRNNGHQRGHPLLPSLIRYSESKYESCFNTSQACANRNGEEENRFQLPLLSIILALSPSEQAQEDEDIRLHL